jgi:hypothetical protein
MRKRWDMSHKSRICFSCLKRHFGECESRMICGVDNCTRNHHRLLHKDIRSAAVTLNIENAAPSIKVMKMLPVQLRGPGGIVDVITLFDDVSNNTLLDSSIALKLGLKGILTPLCCNSTNNITRQDDRSEKVMLEISQYFESNKCFVMNNVRLMKI